MPHKIEKEYYKYQLKNPIHLNKKQTNRQAILLPNIIKQTKKKITFMQTHQNLIQRGAFIALFLLFSMVHNHLSAQSLWGKLYENYYDKKEAKGDYSVSNDEFIATGHSHGFNLNYYAYLLATNQNGNVNWQTYLGDANHNFYGTSVKQTSEGNYIVVGKTDKEQWYAGVYGDSCKLTRPYYNAFIAYINPDSMWTNWYYVFGDPNYNDEATEVIQDEDGYFVVTGSAWGRLSEDSCNYNDSIYTSSYGNDQSGILLSRFDKFGNVSFNKVYYNYYFDNGVSLVNDTKSNWYKVLFNRRDSTQSHLIYPAVLLTDCAGNIQDVMVYDTNSYIERIGQELLLFHDELVVIGTEADTTKVPYTSFLFNIDAGLNLNAYSRVTHPYINLLVKDVLEDNDTLVISGDAVLTDSVFYQNKFLIKVTKNGDFELATLPHGRNITYYPSLDYNDNSNFCVFPYTDSAAWNLTGYHLFGNEYQSYLNHVKTNHATLSMCWESDSIALIDSTLNNHFVPLYDYDLDTLGTFDTLGSYIFEHLACDGSVLDPAPNQEATFQSMAKASFGLSLYPNPATETLNCEIKGENGKALVTVYNSIGTVIYSDISNLSSGKLHLDIASWVEGFYWVNIKTTDHQYSGRFIKQ